MNQKRLPPRLIGCLAPRRVDGPAAASLLSSDSLGLEAACLAFFLAGGRAGGGEESDGTDFLVGFWASLENSELDVGCSTFFLSTGAGERVSGDTTSGAGFSNIGWSSSESSVAESSSDFAFDGPAPIVSHGRWCDFARVDSSQSESWI